MALKQRLSSKCRNATKKLTFILVESTQERKRRSKAEGTMLQKLVQPVIDARCDAMDSSHAVDVIEDSSDATMTYLRAQQTLQIRVRPR